MEKSAIDLLDNVFDESSFQSTSGKNKNLADSRASFQEFDFWTSNPKQDDMRKKSMTEFSNSNWDQRT